jgi:diguanylate cyclase (GGDEF)-like protein
MNLCPLPPNETERLASVRSHQILDTAPEPEFDVTTRVATHLFDLPIAVIALMDSDRLWFKSRQGLEVPQLDRQIAFCAHAIVKPDDLLVIEDLRSDPRFDANPLVQQGPQLRFYAGAPLRDAQGLALGTIAVLGTEPRRFDDTQRGLLRDLSVQVMTALEARRHNLNLHQMATTDPLTGLANRIQFQAAMATTWRRAQAAGQTMAVLYLDLDGFKAVNDSDGHRAGDAVLREVAHRLLPQVRQDEALARLGGDEFAIVMQAGADEQAAVSLAERITQALRPPILLADGLRFQIGVSIGIASAQAEDSNTNILLEQADHALYRAKAQANQRWAIFNDPRSSRPALPTIELALPSDSKAEPLGKCTVCADGQEQPFPFSMAFQPIVRVSDRTVFAYEALVRGTAGESAASILGRVNRRNRYAFDQACRRTAIGLAAQLGLCATSAKLSINFIPGAMYEPENCVRATLAAARRAHLPTDRLIFEVTEGEEVLDPAHLVKIFKVYRDHGFTPAIDDFGAGYSGLNLLAQFQPQLLKLDRALLQDIDASPAKRAIVRGVLSVCTDLQIVPVAEGIETVAEYRTLRTLGIDLFQGYLFARPAFEALPLPCFPD